MSRLITSYRVDSDSPDGETDVPGVGVDVLAGLMGVPADRLVDVYRLEERHTAVLGTLTGIESDLATHEYFLEAVADWSTARRNGPPANRRAVSALHEPP
ncbi:hypothetical protein [Streptomyces wuyuanensis]|uniref:DUF7683 domain-containing protein n=1 Tax=Streptomyces wuyuanensis TaxID=1196353 RepID=UPI0037BAABFC